MYAPAAVCAESSSVSSCGCMEHEVKRRIILGLSPAAPAASHPRIYALVGAHLFSKVTGVGVGMGQRGRGTGRWRCCTRTR
jgi:hypothetical protein